MSSVAKTDWNCMFIISAEESILVFQWGISCRFFTFAFNVGPDFFGVCIEVFTDYVFQIVFACLLDVYFTSAWRRL